MFIFQFVINDIWCQHLVAFIKFELVLAFIAFCHFDQIPGKNQLKE